MPRQPRCWKSCSELRPGVLRTCRCCTRPNTRFPGGHHPSLGLRLVYEPTERKVLVEADLGGVRPVRVGGPTRARIPSSRCRLALGSIAARPSLWKTATGARRSTWQPGFARRPPPARGDSRASCLPPMATGSPCPWRRLHRPRPWSRRPRDSSCLTRPDWSGLMRFGGTSGPRAPADDPPFREAGQTWRRSFPRASRRSWATGTAARRSLGSTGPRP